MIRHYFIIAYRNITRHLNYSLLNIGGLAIGLTSYLFIAIYINDEISYDKFHDKADRIYRVNRLYNSNDVNEDAATCSFPLAPALEFDYPDIVESTCRFFDFQVSKLFFEYRQDSNNIIKYNERNFFLVDSTVFDIFTFPFVKGDPATAFNRPNTIVLTSSTAKRYFGKENPIGKILVAEEGLHFEVTGVIEDVPPQSHFIFDMLGSMSTFRQLRGGSLPRNWIWNPCWTYVLLHENISAETLQEKFPDFYLNHYPDLSEQDVTLYLQKLLNIHLASHHVYEMHPNGNILYIYILSAIAFIILVLACINFMNLTTANSASRFMEIGIKKVFGGSRGKLTTQFLGETIIQSLIALAIAGIIIESFLPLFNHFTGKNISQGLLLQPVGVLLAIFVAIFTGFIAGGYPAVFLSSFKPVAVLQGKLSKGVKSGIARKILVITQFSISIALIIGTLVVFLQLKFIRNADLGFKKDQIILIPTVRQIVVNYDAFKENLLKYPEVEYITGMEDIIGVFSDFHVLSLHKPINNFILDMLHNPDAAVGLTHFIAIRANTNNYKKTLASIKNEWNRYAPNRPFEYSFLDAELDNLYKNEVKFGKFSLVLTILALFIASLGLIGLVSFLAAQRSKEIGVRRVFGARIPDVVKLLSGEFIRLLLVANLIAWPVAYFVTNRWLQNFTQKTTVSWTLYLVAGLVTLLITLTITTSKAISASSRNPADTIRHE